MDRDSYNSVPPVDALRTLLGIGRLLDKESGVKLDSRSEVTLKVIQTFVKQNEENIRNLADYLEASKLKDESMDRLKPGRHDIGTHKVDSGIGTSENRLSNITNESTSSFFSGEAEHTAPDQSEEREHLPHKADAEESNHTDMTERDTSNKVSASSMSSVFGSEKEMSKVGLYDTSGVKSDSGIVASSDKLKDMVGERKVAEVDSDVVREHLSDERVCIFTLGTPSQSPSNIECGPDLFTKEDVPVPEDGVPVYNEARNTDEMNIPSDAQHEKVLNIPNRKLSREELLSRSLSSASNNLALRHMLEARENSTSSESDNLASSSSDGSICSWCGSRRPSQRPSVDLNSPLFY